MNGAGPLLRAAALGRPVAGRVTAGVLLSSVSTVAAVALMGTSGYLISRAAELPPILTLTVAIVGVRFFSLLRAVSRYLERLASHDAALRVLVEARVALLRRLLLLPSGSLPRGGDLLSRAVADVERLQHLFVRALGPPLAAVVVVAATAAAAWTMLPAAGALLLALLAASGVVVPLLATAVASRARARQAPARGALASEVAAAVEGAQELVAFGRSEAQLGRVEAADEALQRLVLRDALGGAFATALGTGAAGATVVALLLVGVPAVASGELSSVLLASLALMALAAFESVNVLPAAAQGVAQSAAAARRLELPGLATDDDAAGWPGLPSPRGPLRCTLRDAAFAPAPGAPPVLRGVTLELGPGERVALVGPSGSGKSTLARALVGLAPLVAGEVLVDGVPLGRLDPAALRDRIRLCDQDAHVFATSIVGNVRIGCPGASDEDVRDVLARVGLGSWLDGLPDGVHTDVGDDGARISGGQRQRIALARGLIAAPDLLVLDEPTSHLDAAAATRFIDDLLDAGEGVGVLLTTHRLAGLERFDRVVVVHDGGIVEAGPPARLAAAGGPFAEMLAHARLVDG